MFPLKLGPLRTLLHPFPSTGADALCSPMKKSSLWDLAMRVPSKRHSSTMFRKTGGPGSETHLSASVRLPWLFLGPGFSPSVARMNLVSLRSSSMHPRPGNRLRLRSGCLGLCTLQFQSPLTSSHICKEVVKGFKLTVKKLSTPSLASLMFISFLNN